MKKIVTLLLLIAPFWALAQEGEGDACIQNIEIAQQRYDEGRIQDIQALLKDCLESGVYSKAQKSQVLRLLTLSYIFLEDQPMAEATMLRLLQTDHEFKVNPAIDPTEFINLHEQFRYKPLFNLGVRYIFNFAQPVVTGLNSSLNLNGSRPAYTIQFGFVGIGVNFEYAFAKNFILYPELHFKSMAINRVGKQSGAVSGTDYITVENFENQNWLSLPVSVKYNFAFKNMPNVKLYANLGGSASYLLNASKPADLATLKMPNDPEVGFTVNTTADKNRLNFGILAGGGATVKLDEGFVSFEVRYLYSLTNLTGSGQVLSPANAAQLNTLVQDDVYRLNHVAISLGYTRYIYIPKQLR